MAGLDEVGIPGPDHLREALTNCSQPLAAIEEFQVQNGILLPSLLPALPFLDLHGVQRFEFHQSIMEELRDKLLQRIAELAESKEKGKNKILNDLLSKSFPVVKVKALRPVALAIMKHLPKIKQEYLKAVVNDTELYKEAAVEVKQQIWQEHQSLFGDEVSPLLSKYIDDREETLFSHQHVSQTFFACLPKARRQDEVVQELVKMIGKNIKLYDMVLQFLRTLFLRTRNVHYCTLRAELLMALHDLDVHDICSIDPCHKFTWCLDACIREQFIDAKRARELQGFLDGIRRGQEQVLGDLSMILCDPHAINTIATSVMKALQQSVSVEGMPRENEELILLLRLLALGLGSWNMIDSQHFKEKRLDTTVVTRFLPCILSLMVDEQLHAVGTKSSTESTQQTEPVAQYVRIACRENTFTTTLLIHYTLQCAKQREINALCRILPVLAQCSSDTVYEDTVLHSLVSYLARMADLFSNADLCQAVFDQFFLPYVSQEYVLRHLLRLLWWTHHKVPPVKLTEVMKNLDPVQQQSDIGRTLYQALVNRIASYKPSPVAEPEQLESPLTSVPAPTPMR